MRAQHALHSGDEARIEGMEGPLHRFQGGISRAADPAPGTGAQHPALDKLVEKRVDDLHRLANAPNGPREFG